MRVFIMEWTDKELQEIKAVIMGLNLAWMSAREIGVKLDVETETVIITDGGRVVKKISVAGDNASGVLCDVVKVLAELL